MSEAFLRKLATVVDLDIVRSSTQSALHTAAQANDPLYGVVVQWLSDMEGRSCELKYALVAELGGDWSLLDALLCDELARRRID